LRLLLQSSIKRRKNKKFMNKQSKQAINKDLRNTPIKKSIRKIKRRREQLDRKEQLRES